MRAGLIGEGLMRQARSFASAAYHVPKSLLKSVHLGVQLRLAVFAYIVLQVLVIVKARGLMRWVAAVPLLGMVPIVVLTAFALAQKSNL
jgi:hypothetical protein